MQRLSGDCYSKRNILRVKDSYSDVGLGFPASFIRNGKYTHCVVFLLLLPMTDVLAGANGFSLQESSINVVSGHQTIVNLPPLNFKTTHTRHRPLFEKTLKSPRLRPRRDKRPVEDRHVCAHLIHQRAPLKSDQTRMRSHLRSRNTKDVYIQILPSCYVQCTTRRYSRKPTKRERKGQKMPLSDNVRPLCEVYDDLNLILLKCLYISVSVRQAQRTVFIWEPVPSMSNYYHRKL